jgi:hypothetical protein
LKPKGENRFQKRAGEAEEKTTREAPPSRGAAHVLDVAGQVTYEGGRPKEVTVLGKTYAFDHTTGTVTIGAVTYRLAHAEKIEQLFPI